MTDPQVENNPEPIPPDLAAQLRRALDRTEPLSPEETAAIEAMFREVYARLAEEPWEGLNPPYQTIVVDPPWHYDKVHPDRARIPQLDLFPRWTAFRSRLRGYRWRVGLAWRVLKGFDPYD